jgi:hypothetical protein
MERSAISKVSSTVSISSSTCSQGVRGRVSGWVRVRVSCCVRVRVRGWVRVRVRNLVRVSTLLVDVSAGSGSGAGWRLGQGQGQGRGEDTAGVSLGLTRSWLWLSLLYGRYSSHRFGGVPQGSQSRGIHALLQAHLATAPEPPPSSSTQAPPLVIPGLQADEIRTISV